MNSTTHKAPQEPNYPGSTAQPRLLKWKMQNTFVFSLLLPGEKCCCGPGTASSIHGCLRDYWECSLECPRFFWQANPPPSNPRTLLHSSVSPSAARGDRAAGDAALMKEWLCEVQGWCLHSRAGRTLLLETPFIPLPFPFMFPPKLRIFSDAFLLSELE